MIFLVKGHLTLEGVPFSRRLAEALNPAPPRWPVDDETLRAWREELAGWQEADTGVFSEPDINVDHAIALVTFEHRRDYPPPPRAGATTPRHVFERWRDSACLDAMSKHLPRIFGVICDLIGSVEHPVLTGSELGTTPQDSLLTRMILFKHSRTPYLKILLREHTYEEHAAPDAPPTATVYGRSFAPEQLLQMIRRDPEGTVSLDPQIQAQGSPR